MLDATHGYPTRYDRDPNMCVCSGWGHRNYKSLDHHNACRHGRDPRVSGMTVAEAVVAFGPYIPNQGDQGD